MDKDYMGFIEDLMEAIRQLLRKTPGVGECEVYLKKEEDYPQTSGDRIFIEYARNQDTREILAAYPKQQYDIYQGGTTVEEIAADTVKDFGKIREAGIAGRVCDLQDYEKARPHLFIRLLNLEKNREELEHSVYRTVGDIAMVLYLMAGSLDGASISMKVSREVVQAWGLDCGRVFERALENTGSLMSPRLYRWIELIFRPDYRGDDFMYRNTCPWFDKGPKGNCISTDVRTNGAIAAFLPGVKERLAQLAGGGYYLVFTSIHEVMVHCDKTVDAQELEAVLRDMIEVVTPEEDVLSHHIYHYDRKTGKITMVETEESRR